MKSELGFFFLSFSGFVLNDSPLEMVLCRKVERLNYY